MTCKCGAEFSASLDDGGLGLDEAKTARKDMLATAEAWIAGHVHCAKAAPAFQPAPMPGPPWQATCGA